MHFAFLRPLLTPVRRLGRAWRATRRSAALVPQVLEAILVLPRMSEQLEVIGFQTATLLDMQAEIARVRGDTAALPPIEETLERMAALLGRIDGNTAAVDQLAQIALPLQGAAARVGRMSDRWAPRAPRKLPRSTSA